MKIQQIRPIQPHSHLHLPDIFDVGTLHETLKKALSRSDQEIDQIHLTGRSPKIITMNHNKYAQISQNVEAIFEISHRQPKVIMGN